MGGMAWHDLISLFISYCMKSNPGSKFCTQKSKLRSHASLPAVQAALEGKSSKTEILGASETRRKGKRKLSNLINYSSEDGGNFVHLCDGLDEICIQCMEIIGCLADASESASDVKCLDRNVENYFENKVLSRKLMEELEKPLLVVGGALPEWCFIAPAFSPRVFSYKVRKLLHERKQRVKYLLNCAAVFCL